MKRYIRIEWPDSQKWIERQEEEGIYLSDDSSVFVDEELTDDKEKDFIIEKEEIEVYGDDGRAVIRAFADRMNLSKEEELTDRGQLEGLINEINYILEYEL